MIDNTAELVVQPPQRRGSATHVFQSNRDGALNIRVYPTRTFAAELSRAARAHYRRENPLVFKAGK